MLKSLLLVIVLTILSSVVIAQNPVTSGDFQVNTGMGRFRGWYTPGGFGGAALEVGYETNLDQGSIIAYDRTIGQYKKLGLYSNTSKLELFTNGNIQMGNRLGIGVAPTVPLEILSPTEQFEKGFQIRIADAASDYLSIRNGTGSPNQFIPLIEGYHASGNADALDIVGTSSDAMDYGPHPIIVFDARRTGSPIQVRPLFSWDSYGAKKMMLTANGNLLINKITQTNTNYKLDIAGKVRADEIVVNTTGADFVFENDYSLKPLSEVEAFIKENKHLPEIPAASEMQSEGMNVGDLQTKLLQKIEELTLYMIEQNQKSHKLENENEVLKKRIKNLEENTCK